MNLTQVPFRFPENPSLKSEDFLIAPCNFEAYELITHTEKWNASTLILTGPKKSGKTHLSRIFSENYFTNDTWDDSRIADFQGAKIVLENFKTNLNEETLLHLFNFIKETDGKLLLTTDKLPDIRLKDLSSRLNATQKVSIGLPDDDFIAGLFLKLFYDLNINISTDVIRYLVSHVERSFEKIKETVEKLNMMSLSAKQKITIPLIKTIL